MQRQQEAGRRADERNGRGVEKEEDEDEEEINASDSIWIGSD